MTTSTLTVTEFVLAQIKEWERWADDEACKPDWDLPATDMPSHPARVLAQCAAMRKIVEMFQTARPAMGEWESDYASAAYDAVRALASIWSDHPDWREEWR
jgi:hypothetical protein